MIRKFPIAALLALFALGSTSAAFAGSAMELTTADKDIRGKRDVETGNYREGIIKLELALTRTNLATEKAPILVNLCVAYTATRELARAAEYCDAAVDNGVDLATAYNNRAVLNMIRGDVEASVADLEKAQLVRPYKQVVKRNLERARAIHHANMVSHSS